MNAPQFAVRVTNLSKTFRSFSKPIDPILERLTGRTRHVPRTVLKDITFSIAPGEVVGFIGENGAGKSTLMRILAGVLSPTAGSVRTSGEVRALLELGTGFSPDRTGRENVLIGGLCLGMSKREIKEKYESIVQFSGLAEYMDQQFGTYSSGMQTRLGFATAIHSEFGILIVDEALSVGDARFQAKANTWLRGLRGQGKTVLIVSHDPNTITNLCDRALLIHQGRVEMDGEPRTVVQEHHRLQFSDSATATGSEGDMQIGEACQYGDRSATVLTHELSGQGGDAMRHFTSGDPFALTMKIRANVECKDVSIGTVIRNTFGTEVWGMTTGTAGYHSIDLAAGSEIEVTFSGVMNLANGHFTIALGIASSDGKKLHFLEDCISFSVDGPIGCFSTSTVNLNARMDLHR